MWAWPDSPVVEAEAVCDAVFAEMAMLVPGVPQHLDLYALVVGVVARVVAVGLQLEHRVVAFEHELLPVAHGGFAC